MDNHPISSKTKKLFTAELGLTRRGRNARTTHVNGSGMVHNGNGADTAVILDAIADLKSDLLEDFRETSGLGELSEVAKEVAMATAETEVGQEKDQLESEIGLVKNEIHALSFAIQQTKEEIAALYNSADTVNRMSVLQHDLQTVVDTTEEATTKILDAVEKMDLAAQNIKGASEDPYVHQMTEEISDNVTMVLEASNFQDLTGQRLIKVVNTLTYIEERIGKIIDIWGEEDIASYDSVELPKGEDNLEIMIDKKADNVEKISQDDIDKLFD